MRLLSVFLLIFATSGFSKSGKTQSDLVANSCRSPSACIQEGDQEKNRTLAITRYVRGCSLRDSHAPCKNGKCKSDQAEACFAAGNAYELSGQTELATQFFLKSCHLGDLPGCTNAGTYLYKNGNQKEAEKIFRNACEKNLGDGCVKLSQFYQEPEQQAELLALNLKGCKLGSDMGCNNVGALYMRAGKVEEAIGFYRGGCAHGYPPACRNLAEHLKSVGRGLEANDYVKQALTLTEKRCNAGYPKDCELMKKLAELRRTLAGDSPVESANQETKRTLASNTKPFKLSGKKLTPKELFKALKPAVVRIETEIGGVFINLGTGFFVSEKGDVLTNHHVVQDYLGGTQTMRIRFHDDTFVQDFKVVKCRDERNIDLCLLQTEKRPEAWFTLGPTEIEVGEEVNVIGHPLGLDYTLTSGMLSGKRKSSDLDKKAKTKPIEMVQMSASVSSGNSGGPIFDSTGRLLGMTTLVFGPVEAQNLNMGISVNELDKFFDRNAKGSSLKEYRSILGLEKKKKADQLLAAIQPILTGKVELEKSPLFTKLYPPFPNRLVSLFVPSNIFTDCREMFKNFVVCGKNTDIGTLTYALLPKNNPTVQSFRSNKITERPIESFKLASASEENRKLLEVLPAEEKLKYFSKTTGTCKPSPQITEGSEFCLHTTMDDTLMGATSISSLYIPAYGDEALLISFWHPSDEYADYFKTVTAVAGASLTDAPNTPPRTLSSPPAGR